MSNERPFNPNKPVQLRNGQPCRILCTNLKGRITPLVVAYGNPEKVVNRYPDGRMHRIGDSDADVVNIPEKRSKFRAVYEKHPSAMRFDSKQECLELAKKCRQIAELKRRLEEKENE